MNKKSDRYKSIKTRCNSFQRPRRKEYYIKSFSYKDVLEKFGIKCRCYLTGKQIDLLNSQDYHLDHIVPLSKGGSCGLDNLAVACKEANQAKHNLTLNEFVFLCKNDLEYHGYHVSKKRTSK